MKQHITIETNDAVKEISFKPAVYMDQPLWEITLDDKTYIIKKCIQGEYRSPDGSLDQDILNKIGQALDGFIMKNAS